MYYLCLDDHHAAKSDADGTVVTSGIVAQLQITYQLLNGHTTSTHNRHKLTRGFSAWTVVHLQVWREEPFFESRSKFNVRVHKDTSLNHGKGGG